MVVLHKTFFIVLLVGEVEEEACLQGSFAAFEGLPAGVVVHTQCVVAAGFEDMIVLILGFVEQLIVSVDGLAVLAHMVVAVSKPETVLDLNVDCPFALQ